MKKVLLGLLLYLLVPLTVLGINYDIKNYYIDAQVLANGDMDVQELIVLKGTFNGYERDLVYKGVNDSLYNADRIDNLEVYAKHIDGKVSFDTLRENFEQFNEVNYANVGDSNKYEINNLSGNSGFTVRMYYPTSKETTAFLLRYTLKNVVIMHTDCAEIYWNFIGNGFEDSISDLNIRVSLPGKDGSFRWWFHGDIAGNSEKYETKETSGVIAKLDKNPAYSAVDNRILFSKDLMDDNVLKKDNKTVLEDITKTEDEIVRQDLERIKYIKFHYTMAVVLTVVYFGVLVLAWVWAYFKYDKERVAQFKNEYNRDFIDDYNVEVVDYLMNHNITPNAMSASIMNLIYKKNIKYEELETGTKKKDYKFTLVNRDNLSETENKLVDFLFLQVGNNTEFTVSQLKKYASSSVTCNKFMNTYTKWNQAVLKDAKSENFFETGLNKAGLGIIMFVFALVVQGYVGMFNIDFSLAFLTIFGAIFFIVYLACSTKKTEKGIEHYVRWKAFKKFLDDFGAFEIKDLPQIELWERYLVYATVFGLADKVSKTMNVKIKEFYADNPNYYAGYYNHGYINCDFGVSSVINSSIRSAYNGSQTAINAQHASASGGSFGGGGGGFSSGGGGGGGGGGGRGF